MALSASEKVLEITEFSGVVLSAGREGVASKGSGDDDV